MQTANDDPTKCVPVPGQETVIEIDKGWQPLGISVIGGCNTLLVSHFVTLLTSVNNEFASVAIKKRCMCQNKKFS